MLLLQAWFNCFLTHSFNGPSWSVSIEYYTYIIFGLILVALKKYGIFIFYLLVIISFFGIEYKPSEFKPEIFKGVGGFFLGTAMYLIYLQIGKAWILIRPRLHMYMTRFAPAISSRDHCLWLRQAFWSVLELSCLALVFLTISFDKRYFFSDITLNAFVVFSFTILIFAKEMGVISSFLTKPVFHLLGKLSYCIYMTHAFVIVSLSLAALGMARVIGDNAWPLPRYGYMPTTANGGEKAAEYLYSNIVVLGITLLIIMLAYIIHKAIEVKMIAVGKSLCAR